MSLDRIFIEINKLASLNFEGWNEAAVREEFIKPLLNLLGYHKSSDYDINHEGEHALSESFIRLGRKRVKIDYAMIIRKKQFWLIEAKPSSPKKIKKEDIFQAHYYAVHPEVNARYFAIMNGWEIIVYDSRKIDKTYQPILEIKHYELLTKFIELNNILGAKNIIPLLKKRVLDDIKDILSIEVIEERIQHFSTDVNSVLESVRPRVKENWKNNYHNKSLEAEQELKQICLNSTCEHLIQFSVDYRVTIHQFQIIAEAFISKFDLLDNKEKNKIVSTIYFALRGRISSLYRLNLMNLLIKIFQANSSLPGFLNSISISDEIKREIKDCITHFNSKPSSQALLQLEGNLYRVIYKNTFFFNGLLKPIFESIVYLKTEILQDEELAILHPNLQKERIRAIERLLDENYRQYKELDEYALLQVNQELVKVEINIDSKFQEEVEKIPFDEQIISCRYDRYNKPFDFLNSGLFHILCDELNIVVSLIDNEIIDLALNLLKKRSAQYSVLWVDVFLFKYFFYIKKYTVSNEVKANYAVEFLKELVDNGNIFVEAYDDFYNETHLVKFIVNNTKSFSHQWSIEGQFDLDEKTINITVIQENLFSKKTTNPLKPISSKTLNKRTE